MNGMSALIKGTSKSSLPPQHERIWEFGGLQPRRGCTPETKQADTSRPQSCEKQMSDFC